MNRPIIYLLLTLFLTLVFFSCAKKESSEGMTASPMGETKIDYKEVRIREMPLAMQCWTFRKFTFLEALQKVNKMGLKFLQAYPGQPLSPESKDLKFDHQMNEDQIQWVKSLLKKYDLKVVSYGVVGFENNEESMRQVFDFAKTMGISTIVAEPKFDDYSLIEKLVKEYNIRIAVHNHPTPSKYSLPQTVLDHIQGLDRRIGVCADVGHWSRSGVKAVDALRLLKGRILDVHLKDLNEFGIKEAYDVPYGQGKVNIHDVLAELTEQNYRGYLAIEYENEEEVLNPEPSILKGIEYIKSITYYLGYKELLESKSGWNHYGPGYFDLDDESGVMKSHGGMGLFWYSREMYADFVLELDYKCSEKRTNSGVFLRVPEFVVSNDYIYRSFEVQIDDNSAGIHKTGSIYDAEPPKIDAAKPTGEWNHFKITFKGKNIKVELNDQLVNDWDAEPRGKIKEFALKGYIGLQNHDSRSPVFFKNVFIKELGK